MGMYGIENGLAKAAGHFPSAFKSLRHSGYVVWLKLPNLMLTKFFCCTV